MPLCRKEELAALWRDQGLKDVREEALAIQTRFVSFDELVAGPGRAGSGRWMSLRPGRGA